MSRTRENRYAVVGDSAATGLIALPVEREGALEFKRRYDRRAVGVGGFYCPRALGGCGGELIVAAGKVNVPHFRHLRKRPAGASCEDPDFERNQDHIRVQQLLASHLGSLGYEASLEYRHENATRSDVLIQGGDLAGISLGIEVQISPQTRERTEARHARYLEGADAVQWIASYAQPFMPGVLQMALTPTGYDLILGDASPDPITHRHRAPVTAPLSQWRIGPVHGEGAETAFLTHPTLESRRTQDAATLEWHELQRRAAEARRAREAAQRAEAQRQAQEAQKKRRARQERMVQLQKQRLALEEQKREKRWSREERWRREEWRRQDREAGRILSTRTSSESDRVSTTSKLDVPPLPAASPAPASTSTPLLTAEKLSLPPGARLPPPVSRSGSLFDGLPWEGTESAPWDHAPSNALSAWWPQVRAALVEAERLEDYEKPIWHNGQRVGSIRRWRLLYPSPPRE
ncbi:hypothetical protein RF640_17915 [Kocuria sp. CPCC 205231]|uniref:hypothetical protein n=1 Tax=Kocuria sp. CPCC 205231 TaxID=3073551 RepID=UPI0034D50C57